VRTPNYSEYAKLNLNESQQSKSNLEVSSFADDFDIDDIDLDILSNKVDVEMNIRIETDLKSQIPVDILIHPTVHVQNQTPIPEENAVEVQVQVQDEADIETTVNPDAGTVPPEYKVVVEYETTSQNKNTDTEHQIDNPTTVQCDDSHVKISLRRFQADDFVGHVPVQMQAQDGDTWLEPEDNVCGGFDFKE